MSFSTNVFLYFFFPLLIIGSFLFHKKAGIYKFLVFLANIFFYIWAGPVALCILIGMIIIVWCFIHIIQSLNNTTVKRFLFIISIVIVPLPLVFFKYNYLFTDKFSLFPLGISFYTFQAISLIVDCYKGKITNEISFIDTFLYITFFVTISAGPITRYNNFKELFINNNYSIDNVGTGIKRFIYGLGKKMILANNIMILANYYFDGINTGESLSVMGLWIGSIAYSLQIYFDFSGYSDMAIGLAQIMGLTIPENFLYPYTATSIKDFWKKWHISLSSWFKDYIYIPLGGNRVTHYRQIFNLLIVWSLTGICHGSTVNFILWGIGYFVLIAAENYSHGLKKLLSNTIFARIYSLFFINLLWIPFRSQTFTDLTHYLSGMVGIKNSNLLPDEYTMHFLPIFILCLFFCFPTKNIVKKINNQLVFNVLELIWLLGILFLSFCQIQSAGFLPFIYGKF